MEVAIDNYSKPIRLRRVPEIFICHSSLDDKLLEEIKIIIEKEKVKPFIANQEMLGINPAEKIIMAISRSDALFVVLTKNALENESTRDWIFFEMGLAKGMWRKYDKKCGNKEYRKVWEQYRIYIWKDPNIPLPNDSPIKFITDYQQLIKRSRKSRNEMLEKMKEISHKISIVR